MWKRRLGMPKTHWYAPGQVAMLSRVFALCSVSYLDSHLVEDDTIELRCTECQRRYDNEMGLFA